MNWFNRFYNRPWLGSWLQRLGSRVLEWWDGPTPYLGPTEASYKPRPTPWLFRDR